MTLIDRARAFIGLAKSAPKWPPDTLSLALQGGGSFGAFTWGVLDRLLEEPGIDFDTISAASAGAVNAAVMVAGMVDGGREEARARLEQFWRRMSHSAALLASPASPIGAGFELLLRSMSPCQFNPLNINPLREALIASIDFERLRARSTIKLLIAATRVSDGRLRILTNHELTVEAILASACLPLLHQSIEIDGEPYWDGGYAANPPLIPLVQASNSDHVLIVQVTPMSSKRLPVTASEISKRIDEIQFNATLNAEFEALKLAKLMGATEKLRRLRIGRISADEEVEGLAQESAGNLKSEFLERLNSSGRAAAGRWLKKDMPRGASRRRAEVAP